MSAPQLFDPPAPDPDPLVAVGPGQVVDAAAGRWGLATATFSGCRTWRYRLSRVWDAQRPRVNFVMLNPSTADAVRLDPTVRRCVGFAHAWGYGALEVTNCFALRSTDPTRLAAHPDPVGPDNDAAIVAAAAAADLVVAAWGVHAARRGREGEVARLLTSAAAVWCLRTTKDGHPGHPLYVPADTVLRRWEARPQGQAAR